jgi:hypothetical protein
VNADPRIERLETQVRCLFWLVQILIFIVFTSLGVAVTLAVMR